MRTAALLVMVLSASVSACDERRADPAPAATSSIGASAVLGKRTLVYESEEALDEAHRFVREGDKEAFALLASTRGTHLEAGTRVKVIGTGKGVLVRRIEVEGAAAKWWVEAEFLGP